MDDGHLLSVSKFLKRFLSLLNNVTHGTPYIAPRPVLNNLLA